MCMLMCLSRVQLFGTQWTVAHQVPLSMGFSPGTNTRVGCYALLQGISQPRDQIWGVGEYCPPNSCAIRTSEDDLMEILSWQM